MIQSKQLTLVEAWNELNKVNNRIDLLETQMSLAGDISSSKLKEIMTQCSFSKNDKFINTIISNDKRISEWFDLRMAKISYEEIVENEINRTKLSEPAICIAFLKEYMKKKNDEIAKEMNFSISQVKRYYAEYKGRTPSDNSYFMDVK